MMMHENFSPEAVVTISDLFTNLPALTSDRLVLRQLHSKDAQDYYEIFSDDEVTRYYDVDTMTSIEQARALIDRHDAHYRNRVSIRYALELKETGKVIGTIGLYNFKEAESVEIGFDLNRRYWKQGYMTEAIKRIIDFTFQNLRIYTVYGGFLKANTASENLMKRLGFKKGKVADDVEIKPGVFETVYFYRLDGEHTGE